MKIDNFRRSPAIVWVMLAFGQGKGIQPNLLLRQTGLTEQQLTHPQVSVLASQELLVIRNLIHQSQNEIGLGLQVGARLKFATYGVWGLRLVSSATVGEALEHALRFLSLTSVFSEVSYRVDGDHLMLSFKPPPIDEQLRAFVLERDIAGAIALFGDVLGMGGEFSPTRIELPEYLYPKQGRCQEQLEAIVSCPVLWGGEDGTVFIKREILDRVPSQANALTARMCDQVCEELQRSQRVTEWPSAMVAQYMQAFTNAAPRQGAIAGLMSISDRTLRRKLHQSGTNYRSLTIAARKLQAQALVLNAQLTLTEVSERLGYADLSSFSQAFKRWFGMAPKHYRMHQLERPSDGL